MKFRPCPTQCCFLTRIFLRQARGRFSCFWKSVLQATIRSLALLQRTCTKMHQKNTCVHACANGTPTLVDAFWKNREIKLPRVVSENPRKIGVYKPVGGKRVFGSGDPLNTRSSGRAKRSKIVYFGWLRSAHRNFRENTEKHEKSLFARRAHLTFSTFFGTCFFGVHKHDLQGDRRETPIKS
jgi:hypothetical protein